MEIQLAQVVLLLGASVVVVLLLQRLGVPSSLAYLPVGIMVGPHTPGPVIDTHHVQIAAEFGIVFLLFTIGLNFSLPQIHALRRQVLGLGTGQVVLTTAAVGLVGWLAGLPGPAAFVIGAVFAQSSTTIITKQLLEQGEENSRHGRLGTAMSVFQDVTAAPFVIVIPVLGMAVGTAALAAALGWALAKAVLAFAAVVLVGRWLLRPLFHLVVARRSAEVFTLTVLFVSLFAAWTTHSLGLSMAFGAFLAGMVLGDTEFRHQVESAIRPFRDVLLGLFFIGIGMLFDPASIPHVWKSALLGAAALLVIKAVVVVHIVRWAGMDSLTAWRIGLLLAVGGEFGFALLAIALGAGVLDERIGQIALNAVLCSMIVAPFLIRFNQVIASRLVGATSVSTTDSAPRVTREVTQALNDHVIICGYGRIGQNVGNFLEEESIPFIALDLDPATVKQAHTAGEPVFYGDAGEREMLELVGLRNARLLVVSHADVAASLRVLHQARALRPDIPIMVRTPDEHHADEIRAAGATEVVPETLAAGLMIASQALVLMDVPLTRIVRRVREQHAERYRLLREIFRSSTPIVGDDAHEQHRLQAIVLPEQCAAVGRPLADYLAADVVVTALVRRDERRLSPAADTRLQAGDVVVVFGLPEALRRVEASLLLPAP